MNCNFDGDGNKVKENGNNDDNDADRNIAYSKAGNFMTCTLYGMHRFGKPPRPTIL